MRDGFVELQQDKHDVLYKDIEHPEKQDRREWRAATHRDAYFSLENSSNPRNGDFGSLRGRTELPR
jgi:hypothetical protein